MTASTALEHRLRRNRDIPVDYDATSHVVTAAARATHLHPSTHRQREALFLLVHWGYGSAVGSLYRTLREAGLSPVRAAAVFFLACQSMAFTLFPVLGGTPPPWQWRRDVLASSLAQHLVYVVTVAAVDARTADMTAAARTR